MGKIIIKELELFAYHGVNPEEKENGQRFILDIVASSNLQKACLTDNLDFTTSYAKMIKTASAVFLEGKDDLIERAAYKVAEALLREYPKLEDVKVTVKKPDAPIKAVFGYAAVEIKKERER
ncbi:MAG TPA: dihydroneopterin aldolase [Oscillospiraceae bacterium]|nr:dihydroneopterin aldolase [Oscillospiraceae bacterium]